MVKDFDILDFEEAGPGLAFTSEDVQSSASSTLRLENLLLDPGLKKTVVELHVPSLRRKLM